MNEPATKMTDEAKQSEHQQDHKYCPQHKGFLSVKSYLPSREAVLLRLSKCKFLRCFGEVDRRKKHLPGLETADTYYDAKHHDAYFLSISRRILRRFHPFASSFSRAEL